MKKLEKILLVDDDPTNNFLNSKLLNDLKFAEEIVVLTNGKLAFDYIQENCNTPTKSCPALIILDHHMPVMDGMEFMKLLNNSGILKTMEVVVLLLAVQTKPEDLILFQKLGVQEFTPKPLSKKRLMEAYQKYWAGDTAKNHTNQ